MALISLAQANICEAEVCINNGLCHLDVLENTLNQMTTLSNSLGEE